jgi:BirA family biotin operon repressor/biotin-[acetyl-CoA-carboxylase] ligase
MYQQHFNTIGSTQIFLKENLDRLKSKDSNILISCSEQTGGIGRKGNSWDSYPNSVAMSFTLKPNAKPTLTPIEVGLIAIRFFHKKFNKELFLKWPNDLLTADGKKCGGILCQYIDNNTVIVGLGVNLGKLSAKNDNDYKHGLGNVDDGLTLTEADQEKISKELYAEFLNQRYFSNVELMDDFTKYCHHMDKDVFIFEDEKDFIGIFRGIGENGEALVEIDGKIKSFLSSSLTILD